MATLSFASSAQVGGSTEQLYRVLAQANESGWTADLRRDAAELYLLLGDFDAALAHWEVVLQLTPDDLHILRRTAELYVQRARWPEALAAVRRLREFLPDDGWANLHLGMLLATLDPTDSIMALRRAAQANMPPPDGLITLLEAERASPYSLALEVGTVMADARLYAYAERAFTQAAAFNVGRAEALALVALMRGLQSKDGQRWLDEAVAIAPNSPHVHTTAGFYYRATGQTTESMTAFATALAIEPLNPELYAELGRSYEVIGAFDTALFWYEQAVLIAPHDERYRTIRDAAANLLEMQSIIPPP